MKSSTILSEKISIDELEHCRNVIKEATPREIDVLQAFSNGLNYKQVALLLNITQKTVEMHAMKLRFLCCLEWELPPNKKLPNCFLHATFAAFFQYEMGNVEKGIDESMVLF